MNNGNMIMLYKYDSIELIYNKIIFLLFTFFTPSTTTKYDSIVY